MAKDNAYDAVNSPFGQMNNDTRKINEGGVKPKKQAVKKSSAPKRPVNHKNINRKPTKPQANNKYDEARIPGYSTVRMSKTNSTAFKNIQKAVGFKSRNALITDMLKRCKIMYLNTPKKRADYRKFNKISVVDYKLRHQV